MTGRRRAARHGTFERRSRAVVDLSREEIAASRMDPEHGPLNALLDEERKTSRRENRGPAGPAVDNGADDCT